MGAAEGTLPAALWAAGRGHPASSLPIQGTNWSPARLQNPQKKTNSLPLTFLPIIYQQSAMMTITVFLLIML